MPCTQGCFVPSLDEIGLAVLEKKIFKFCQCVFVILKLSPFLEKDVALHLIKIEWPHPRMFCFKFGSKLVQWFWRLIDCIGFYAVSAKFQPYNSGKDFKISFMYFCYFVISGELKAKHYIMSLDIFLFLHYCLTLSTKLIRMSLKWKITRFMKKCTIILIWRGIFSNFMIQIPV